jgi:hypothetical protein
MFATVEIPMDRTSSCAGSAGFIHPADGRKTFVFVRNSEKEFQKREVQTGIASGGYTEIKSGLKGRPGGKPGKLCREDGVSSEPYWRE